MAEQVLLLENIGTSIKVGPTQLSSLHKLLLQASSTLQMEHTPELYVRQHPVPNAYTLAIAGRKPFVVVHTALLELLDPSEIQVGARWGPGGGPALEPVGSLPAMSAITQNPLYAALHMHTKQLGLARRNGCALAIQPNIGRAYYVSLSEAVAD